MAKFMDTLTDGLIQFIGEQHVFFTATAPAGQGRINLSPKGMDTFRCFSPSSAGYLDVTGSGNETSAHLLDNGRMTIMFCSFSEKPLILRLYGRGRVIRPGDADWAGYFAHFESLPGQRQIIALEISSVQTSCGFGVPELTLKADRPRLIEFAQSIGEEKLGEYRASKNVSSIDGLPTGYRS